MQKYIKSLTSASNYRGKCQTMTEIFAVKVVMVKMVKIDFGNTILLTKV